MGKSFVEGALAMSVKTGICKPFVPTALFRGIYPSIQVRAHT